jgi:hypothetical protein
MAPWERFIAYCMCKVDIKLLRCLLTPYSLARACSYDYNYSFADRLEVQCNVYCHDLVVVWLISRRGSDWLPDLVKVKITLRLTVSRPVSLDVRHPSGTRDQFFSSFLDSYGFVDVGRPLWREVGSVVFSCCWASPVESILGLSPTELIACTRFIRFTYISNDRPNGLVVRVTGYTTEMYCDSCEVRTEFIYVM